MSKFWTNTIVVGALGGVGTNAMWALLSNVTALQPYLPTLLTKVAVPIWAILGVATFTVLAAVIGLITRRSLRKLQGAAFKPNDVELAILVSLRATDRPVPDEAIQDHIYKKPDSPFGREDVRVGLLRLHNAGWLCYEAINYDVYANALTEKSLAHMRKLNIGPKKQPPNA
jgi:hypothetical protein